MGSRHARVLSASPLARVVAIVDPVTDTAQALASRVGAVCCELEAAFAMSDAVVIASPTEHHARLVASALEAGKHVLVEKPLCETAALGRELSRTARARGLVLAVGHSERFNPAIRALFSLGLTLEAIDTRRLSPLAPEAHRAGLFLNLGVHDFDLCAHLARGATTLTEARGDADHAWLRTLGEAFSGSLELQHGAPSRVRTLRARAASGEVYEADLARGVLLRLDTTVNAARRTPDSEPLAAQAHAFLDTIRGSERTELANGDEAAAAVALAEQAHSRLAASP